MWERQSAAKHAQKHFIVVQFFLSQLWSELLLQQKYKITRELTAEKFCLLFFMPFVCLFLNKTISIRKQYVTHSLNMGIKQGKYYKRVFRNYSGYILNRALGIFSTYVIMNRSKCQLTPRHISREQTQMSTRKHVLMIRHKYQLLNIVLIQTQIPTHKHVLMKRHVN